MKKTRSMAINQNHDDAMFKTSDNGGAARWSDLNHDVLFLVMMQLRVVDFLSFSKVCKSWRTLAVSNRNKFMAFKPPMSISISSDSNDKEFYLEDSEERKFKSLLPHTADTRCLGLTCGYLVMVRWKTNDFCLVNPITSHELHFPALPSFTNFGRFKGVLVFSPSIPGRVFIVINRFDDKIWFSIEGKGAWNLVSTTSDIIDLHAFKGKIYTLHTGWRVCEMRLNPVPKLTLLEIKNLPNQNVIMSMFVSSDENLYVMDYILQHPFQELDLGEMKWKSPKEKTIEEYPFFYSIWKCGSLFKPELWVGRRSQYNRYDFFSDSTDKNLKGRFFGANMWYFPHLCLNVDLVDE